MTTLSILFLLASTPPLIPLPQELAWNAGSFELNRNTGLINKGATNNTLSRLREATDLILRNQAGTSSIVLEQVPGMPDEAYTLEVTPLQLRLTSSSDAGFFYGIQTLKQLNQNGRIRAVKIKDAPRFGWRGLMLDESRHFFGPKFVRKYLDGMAAHKFNNFHWHLTDDGGWRMESKRFPELTRVGAFRKEQGVEWDYGNLWFPGPSSSEKLYGGFYNQDELRSMVDYARVRHINIVPEIEMPGHSLAATASKPELQCEPPPGVMAEYLKGTNSQAPTMMCPGKDSTIEFCKNILDETMALFPSKFIHIGADEVDKTLWRQCKHCQARMKANNLKDEHELQSWFVRQMDAYLASKGRRLIGWDEILEGGLAPGAAVMSWRGISGGIAAAQANHDVVMSPTSHCYFDYSYDTIPTSLVYSYEVIPAALTGEQRNRVLGGQANIWTEWLSTPAEVESMTYPRALALAETLWTQPERKSWSDFEARLNAYYPRLEQMKIAFRLGAPKLDPDVLNLAANKEWKFTRPDIAGAQLVLEDGTVVTGATVPATNKEVKVYFQLPGGRRGDPAVGRVVNLTHTTALNQPGLLSMTIPWTKNTAPPLSEFENAKQAEEASISLVARPTKPYALRFKGGLVVDKPGRYTIGIGSDDGSVLYLDGQKVIDNDGAHPYIERTVTIDLQPGVYPMDLVYFEAGGSSRLEFFWTPPGGTRQAIQSFRHQRSGSSDSDSLAGSGGSI
ncbi:MAG: family 20 glycosylhydrolase [Fimbriimonas sp.]